MSELAIQGGKRAFQHEYKEKWARPKLQEKQLISILIDRNELSGAGTGVCREFENAFAAYIGCKYCLTFSHGTTALAAAYYACGIGPGDEVITPALGFIASYSGAMHMGARPVFCDVDPNSFLIDPECIRRQITQHTKAINIVHLWGRICNLDVIFKISAEYGIPIVDDASHAHGGEWDGRKLGNFDHITCFSFQGVNPGGKAVAAGEGGVACTNNHAYYQRMLAYCHLHRHNVVELLEGSPYQEMDRQVLGLKSRMHPFALAVALVSLSTLDYRNAMRTLNYQRTVQCLKEFDFISIPQDEAKGKMAGFFGGLKFLYKPDRLDHLSTSMFIRCLQEEGVPITGPGAGFLEHRHTIFEKGFDLWGRGRGPIDGPWAGLDKYTRPMPSDFPVAEDLNQRAFTLPSFIEVDDGYYSQLKEAFFKVQKFYKNLLNK